jgi:hypothetical protein
MLRPSFVPTRLEDCYKGGSGTHWRVTVQARGIEAELDSLPVEISWYGQWFPQIGDVARARTPISRCPSATTAPATLKAEICAGVTKLGARLTFQAARLFLPDTRDRRDLRSFRETDPFACECALTVVGFFSL